MPLLWETRNQKPAVVMTGTNAVPLRMKELLSELAQHFAVMQITEEEEKSQFPH